MKKLISLSVPYGTDLSSVLLNIKHSGISFSPETPQDFSAGKSVSYTITARDGTKETYQISITIGDASAENKLTELILTLSDIDYDAIIDQDNNTISIKDLPAIPSTAIIKNIRLSAAANSSVRMGETLAISNKSATISITAQNGDRRVYTINFVEATGANTVTASMAWVSLREGVIEIEGSTNSVDMGVIVSREATAPAYETVKDLPGFYTRKSKGPGIKRTVYLSMTNKMTNDMLKPNTYTFVDGSVAGFNALSKAPELMHANTKYYAYIYYSTSNLSNSAKTTKIEFTTEAFPTTFPTGPTAGAKQLLNGVRYMIILIK